jgi:hypothetical protein
MYVYKMPTLKQVGGREDGKNVSFLLFAYIYSSFDGNCST